MKFLLFDIDGTLVDTGGAGSRALNAAFFDVFGVSDAFRMVSMAGKTDLQIIREGMTLHGISSENGVVPEFCLRYLHHLERNMEDGTGRLKPGIPEALGDLEHDRDFHLGLLTGNMERGAFIKLKRFGIARFFDLGAFGDEDEDRNRLLPIAVGKLSREKNLSVSYQDCVVIGDTPRDVACARPHGALAVAVATGPYSCEELAEAKPDLLFQDFLDTEAFLSALRRL